MIIAILAGVYCGIAILLNPTGGIAGMSKLITFICIVIAFISPRHGIFVLALQAIFNDEIKRVGVFYGAVSMETVQEILVGPILTLCALNAGFLLQVLFGRIKINKLAILLFAMAPLLGLYFLSGGAIGDNSFTKRLYNGSVAGLYTTLVPIGYCLFKELKDWIRFLSFQTVLVVPSALWAIWQYFNGFNNMEWTYALSGLSPVHSGQMLMFENPRVFGLFGSASALGCLSIYFAFAMWRVLNVREWRWGYLLLAAIFFGALIASTQRSALLMPFIFMVAAFFARSKLRTLVFYSTMTFLISIGIWQSTWLLETGIDKVNNVIASNSRWGNEVLKVSTFSDRIRGWERMKKPEIWSLFGTGVEDASAIPTAEEGSHDMINRILARVGAVGLLSVTAAVVGIGWLLHRMIWKLPAGIEKSAASMSLGTAGIIIIFSALGGDNFTTTPINLAIWSAFAGVFVVKKQSENLQLSTTKQTIKDTPVVIANGQLISVKSARM